MPTAFGVRAGTEMSCTLEVAELPSEPTRARIKVLAWSGSHVERIKFNDTELSPKIGREHDFAVDLIEVPPEAVKRSRNTFSMVSSTMHHAAEVDWPGPVLLLEFTRKCSRRRKCSALPDTGRCVSKQPDPKGSRRLRIWRLRNLASLRRNPGGRRAHAGAQPPVVRLIINATAKVGVLANRSTRHATG